MPSQDVGRNIAGSHRDIRSVLLLRQFSLSELASHARISVAQAGEVVTRLSPMLKELDTSEAFGGPSLPKRFRLTKDGSATLRREIESAEPTSRYDSDGLKIIIGDIRRSLKRAQDIIQGKIPAVSLAPYSPQKSAAFALRSASIQLKELERGSRVLRIDNSMRVVQIKRAIRDLKTKNI